MAYPAEAHRARKLLEEYGVGFDVLGDRGLTTAAFGDRALRVPSPNGKSKHVVWASKYQKTVEDVARELLKRDYGSDYTPSAEQVAGQVKVLRDAGGALYPDDDALMAQARQQQKLVALARFQRMEGAERLLDLARDKADLREQLLPMMGIDPAALNARPAAAGGDPAWVMEAARQQAQGAGYSVVSREAELREAALRAQLEDAQRMIDAAKVAPQPPPPATANAAASTPPPGGDAPAAAAAARTNANPEVIPPEVNNWWTATAPELKGIPVLKHIPNWGYVGAGAAGASALAYHLMAAGQQQQNNAAYAAQVQAMNAY